MNRVKISNFTLVKGKMSSEVYMRGGSAQTYFLIFQEINTKGSQTQIINPLCNLGNSSKFCVIHLLSKFQVT